MDALNLSEVTYPSIQDVPSLGEGSGQVKSMPLVTCQENLNQNETIHINNFKAQPDLMAKGINKFHYIYLLVLCLNSSLL